MGVVRRPHLIVHADGLPHLDAQPVLDERRVDVLPYVLAGRALHLEVQPVPVPPVALVGTDDKVAQPADAPLGGDDLQVREAVEDATEEQVGDGHGVGEVAHHLVGHPRPLPRVAQGEGPLEPPVDREGDAHALGRVPQRIVVRLVVAAIRKDGHLGRHDPVLFDVALQLGHRHGDVLLLGGQHRRADEPAAVVGAELGHPVVPRADARQPQLRVLEVVQAQAHAGVQDAGVDTVGPHVVQVRLGVPAAARHLTEGEAAGSVALIGEDGRGVQSERMGLLALDLPPFASVGHGNDARRPLPQSRRHSLVKSVRRLDDVTVGRDDVVLHGGTLQSLIGLR